MFTYKKTMMAVIMAMASGAAMADGPLLQNGSAQAASSTVGLQPVQTLTAQQVQAMNKPTASDSQPNVSQVSDHFSYGDTSVSSIDKLKTKASVLKVELEIAKLEKSINDAKAGKDVSDDKDRALSEKINGINPSGNMIPQGGKPLVTGTDTQKQEITLLRISGVGKKYTATLSTPDGQILTVKPHQYVGDGVKILEITSDYVAYMDGDKKKRLFISKAAPPVPATNTGLYPGPGMFNSSSGGVISFPAPQSQMGGQGVQFNPPHPIQNGQAMVIRTPVM